jgi:flagellar basal-body rod protein FlgC
MNYSAAFAISASGMSVEKTRLDVTAVNLANIHSTRTAEGGPFKPLRVISGEGVTTSFSGVFDNAYAAAPLRGAQVIAVEATDTPPRMVHEPTHPDADEKGFVAYPGINHVSEMVNLVTAVRAYEANVVAMNAAKTMALKALDLGGAS